MTDICELVSYVTLKNPGAISIVTKINDFGFLSISVIVTLIELNITGGKLWSLYKDICGNDIKKTIMLIQSLIDSEDPKSIRHFCKRSECEVNVIEYLRSLV